MKVRLIQAPVAYWSRQAELTVRDTWPRLFGHGHGRLDIPNRALLSLGERAGVDGGALSPSWRHYARPA